MNYDTLIWSGCSHSFGSAMLDEDFNSYIKEYGTLENAPVKWQHPKLYESFPNVVTVAQATEAIKQRAYPHQIGKKLGFKNIFNFSVQGTGIDIQLRKVSSFIIENENKIDFSKAVFCYQLPEFSRVEIIKNNIDCKFDETGWGWLSFNFQTIEENNSWAMDYFIRHFDYDFYVAKSLLRIYEYKGFLESKGIKFLPFCFCNNIMQNIEKNFPYKRKESVIQNLMNNRTPWTHYNQNFPSKKELIEKIELWEVNFSEPIHPKSLREDGFNDDGHWSPNGHDAIANNLAPQLKEKLML